MVSSAEAPSPLQNPPSAVPASGPSPEPPADSVAAASAPIASAPVSRRPLRAYAFALVPLIGLLELGAHEIQIHSVVPDADWDAARATVEAEWKPGDLVVVAPFWVDSVARMHLGAKLVGIPDEARPDDTRFPRAFEVSIRGAHDPGLADWKKVESRKVGAVTVTTLENPAPVTLVDDLLAHASPAGMSVSRVDNGNETECHPVHGATTAGGLGAGPATPGDRFVCNGNAFVGVSIIHDLADLPRRCFFAPTAGGSSVVRVHFTNVAFGGALHGHLGLANFNERDRTGPPVSLTFRANDRIVGKVTHLDGDGWKGFELSTGDLAGQHADLIADIASSGAGRQFCFEADTR